MAALTRTRCFEWSLGALRGHEAATALSFRPAISFLCPTGRACFGVYHSPCKAGSLHLSEAPPGRMEACRSGGETRNTFPPTFAALEAVEAKGREEKQKPPPGAAGGIIAE